MCDATPASTISGDAPSPTAEAAAGRTLNSTSTVCRVLVALSIAGVSSSGASADAAASLLLHSSRCSSEGLAAEGTDTS